MEKEKLIKIAKKLHQEAFDANAYYLIMQQYKECHSRYINELNISPAFYSVVYEALQKACFMEVAKLYDKTRDAFSIGDFLETCKNNEKIFLECKEFIEYTCDGQDYKDEVPYQHILKEDEKIFFKDEVKYHCWMAEVQMVLFLQQCLSLNVVKNRCQNAEILWLWQMRRIVVNMDLMREL